jgi:hypothetical protein
VGLGFAVCGFAGDGRESRVGCNNPGKESVLDSPTKYPQRFFAMAYVLIVAGFFLSATYWDQYNAHLAVPESLLAGFASAALWRWASSLKGARWARSLGALLALGILPQARRAWLDGRQRSKELVDLGHYVRNAVPRDACLMSFEPACALAGGRLPTQVPGLPLAVDSYAMMLLQALRSGERFENATAALHSQASQDQIRRLLDGCRFVVLGEHGRRQLAPETARWFGAEFVRVSNDFDLWERAR